MSKCVNIRFNYTIFTIAFRKMVLQRASFLLGDRQMKMTNIFLGLAATLGLIVVGCSEVDYGDVQSARDNVQEEQNETMETRREVAENVQEEEAETAEAHREAMKPVLPNDEVTEEAKETEEAREAGAKAIAEEEKETREAEAELQKKEQQLAAKESRDAFVKKPEALVETANQRIDVLQEKAEGQEGATKTATEDHINELQTRRDRVEELVDEVNSAELMKWETHREPLQKAIDALQAKLDETK